MLGECPWRVCEELSKPGEGFEVSCLLVEMKLRVWKCSGPPWAP